MFGNYRLVILNDYLLLQQLQNADRGIGVFGLRKKNNNYIKAFLVQDLQCPYIYSKLSGLRFEGEVFYIRRQTCFPGGTIAY